MWDVQELFRRHSRDVTRFLRGRVSSPEVAADLTQELFLRLLTTAPASVQNRESYLFRAASNLAYTYRTREKLVQFVRDDDLLATLSDEQPDAERMLQARQELRAVSETLAEFSPVQREIFMLSRIDGLTYDAIGKRLSLPLQTVYSHVVRMLVRLQVRLDTLRA
jgi:RNA polymerase sigma-70 factor (ECF subfamily)